MFDKYRHADSQPWRLSAHHSMRGDKPRGSLSVDKPRGWLSVDKPRGWLSVDKPRGWLLVDKPRGWLSVVLACLGLFCILIATSGEMAWGQSKWEITPYKVRIWLVVDPPFSDLFNKQLMREIQQRAETYVPAAWSTEVVLAPASLWQSAVTTVHPTAMDQLTALADDIWQQDKLILVSIGTQAEGYLVSLRELDCRTRTWGRPLQWIAAQPAALPDVVFSGILQAFSPLVQLENAQQKQVIAQVRASALSRGDDCPVLVKPGDLLRPIDRRNDRFGNPKPDGIRAMPWTLLRVTESQQNRVDCQIHSGMRNPLSGRRNIRTERLALLVRPAGNSTRLLLRSRTHPDRPLIGYEVLSRSPEEQRSESIGYTDWQGALDIRQQPTAGQSVLRILYIKNGSQLLARLPLIPGEATQVTALVSDDDLRLEAEIFVTGLEKNLVDLVARRAVLAARIRRRIKDSQLKEAEKLLEKYRTLEARSELDRIMQQERQQLVSDDQRIQHKIDKMFAQAQKMLGKYLDPRQLNQLTTELARARTGEK